MNDLPTRRAFARAGASALEKRIDEAREELAAEREVQRAVVLARVEADRLLRGTVTRAHLAEIGAGEKTTLAKPVRVRDDSGWHAVLRLNAKTVTVPGPWGGTRLVPIGRLLEVRP